MPSNWEKIKKNVKRELSDAAATTKKYSKIGKVKLDMMNMNNSLNDTFKELGIEVYNQITDKIKGGIQQNQRVKDLVDKVNHYKQFIKDEKIEIEVIRKGSDSQT